jgi:GTP cyclohydrolase I
MEELLTPEQIKKAALTRFPSPIDLKLLDSRTDQEKIAYIAVRLKEILEALGLDLSDDSIARTPERVAKMYVSEVFKGLRPENFPAISFITDQFQHAGKSNIVFLKTAFYSFCEHHLVPMHGKAYIAYFPKKKLIGLSKIPRIVRYFSSRPQVQERLTAQIADCLAQILETEDVAVSLSAEHFCVKARGIEDEHGHATTSVFRGNFQNPEIKAEFFEAINRPSPDGL